MPYYTTQRETNHQKVIFSVVDRQLYLHLLRENLGGADVRVLAYCLMANHVHLVVIPNG